MLTHIDIRLHNDYAVEASLHGIKVPFKQNIERLAHEQLAEDEAFDPAIAEKAMIDAQQRVKERYA